MARSCSINNYLVRSSPGDVGGAGTIFVKFNPSWSSGDLANHVIWSYSDASVSPNVLNFFHMATNVITIGWVNAGVDKRVTVSDAGLFTAGTWANHFFDWDDATDLQNYYVNNFFQANSVLAFTAATGIAEFAVGATSALFGVASGSIGADGDLAEYARWTRVLTTAERTVLQLGASPLFIPNGLARYLPIIGRNSPENEVVAGLSLTVSGSPAVATHPRIFSPITPNAATLTATVIPGNARRGDSNILIGAG